METPEELNGPNFELYNIFYFLITWRLFQGIKK